MPPTLPRRRPRLTRASAVAALATAAALAAPAAALGAALPLDLPSSGTLRFDGAPAERTGATIAGACDLTGDGRDDAIVGAPAATVGGTAATGRVFVVPGAAARAPGAYDLVSGGAQPSAGAITIVGDPSEGSAGTALACAGDVNGGGIDDLLLSATDGDTTGTAYVVFGDDALAPGDTIDLAALGARGFAIVPQPDFPIGYRVAGLGDLDGDGKAEIAVSDKWGDQLGPDEYPGTVYVIAGKSDTATVDLAQPSSTLLRISGAVAGDNLRTVAGPGDVNGDGVRDILVGAPEHAGPNGAGSGAAYVVSGRARGAVALSATPGGASGILFAIWGDDATTRGGGSTSAAHLGNVIAAAGDVDDDGRADLALRSEVGEIGLGRTGSDRVVVVYGKSDSAPVDLQALGDDGYAIDGVPSDQSTDGFGAAIAPLGDVNGDDYEDLAVGAPTAASATDGSAGAAYVLYGRAQAQPLSVASMTCEDGARFFGGPGNDRLGESVAGGGSGFTGATVPQLITGTRAAEYVRVVPLTPITDGCGRDPISEPPALELDFGLRESFRKYVSNGFNPASPAIPISASGGAICAVNPDAVKGGCDPRVRALPADPLPRRALRWTPIGADATDGSDTTVASIGTVVFRYPSHYFTLTLRDPWVAVSNGTATLRARVTLEVADGFAGARPADVRIALGSYPLDGAATVTDQYVQWTTLDGALTNEAGEALGGFLPAGAELDPITITIPRSLGALPDEPTVPQPRGPEPRQPEPRQPEPRQPEPRQPEPRQPLPNPVATIAAGARRVTVKRAGSVLLARVGCRVADCAVTVPRTARLPFARAAAGRGGRRLPRSLVARLAAPRSVKLGKRGDVRLVLGRAAVKALAGRSATVKVTVIVRASGRRVAKTVAVTVRGSRARS